MCPNQNTRFCFSILRLEGGGDGTAESRRIVFFGRLTLLDPADTSFLWGCFTAAMTGGGEGLGVRGEPRIKALG